MVRYRAAILKDGKAIESLPGSRNTRAQLDAWLTKHWPWTLSYETVESWEVCVELKIWRYGLGLNSLWRVARRGEQYYEPHPDAKPEE